MSSLHSAKVAKIARTARMITASLLPVITFLAIASFSPGGATAGVIPGVENRARLTRNEATGRTMPTAWELKMEIPDKTGVA
jgi:hypothetical protein